MTADLSGEGASKPALREAPADEGLLTLQFGMTYQGGKHRGLQAHELAIRTVAQMAYDHLELSGYVIVKAPPSDAMALTRCMGSKIPMED